MLAEIPWVRWRTRPGGERGGAGSRRHRPAFAWLAAGAVTLGLSVAMIGGAGLASADDGSATSGSTSSDNASKSDQKEDSQSPADRDDASSVGDPKTSAKADTDAAKTAPADRTSRKDRDEDSPKVKRFGNRADKPSPTEAKSPESDSATPAAGDDTAAVTPAGSGEAAEAKLPRAQQTSAKVTEFDSSPQSARAPPLQSVTTDSAIEPAANASAGAAQNPLQALLEDIVRHLQYTFANVAPTMAPGVGTPSGNGIVTGDLNGKSNNGFGLTYTVTQEPQHGTVTIDQATGRYTYTASKFDPRVTDSFVITASNGAAAQLPGVAGVVQGVLHSVAQGLGMAAPDTVSAIVTVKAVFPNTYGDPGNALYWAEQHFENCVLMSVAMITGQLRGVVPTDQTENDIIKEASETESVEHPGQMMWYSSTQEGVSIYDGQKLLENHGFDTEFRYFGDRPFVPGTTVQGGPALAALGADLAAGHGVMVDVNAESIWTAEQPGWYGPDIFKKNHAIVVLAIDYGRGLVYVNDSGLHTGAGQGAAVSLPAFMWAWQASGYVSVVAKKPVAEEEEGLRIAA